MMQMASTIAHHYVTLEDVRLHYVTAGPQSGNVVVLLHGWPQTWTAWRHAIPLLPDCRIIAPDLRGLGDSSRPDGGYDKRSVAADIWQLLDRHLSVDRFFVVGHDWGGVVAYALTAAHPENVLGLAVLDVTPPLGDARELSQSGKRWHHAFHRTQDLPEVLITGREREYLTWFFRNFSHRSEVFSELDIGEFIRAYSQPGAIRASMEYYRAIPTDCLHTQENITKGPLTVPVLALGGAEAWGRGEEPLISFRKIASNVSGGAVADCGHFIPEEQPARLVAHLRELFESVKAP